ncbi:hypothetical protein [Planctomicrobium piriforme]|uniref:hypothetical protein n=1 Tax=Planctomicrobium piriforme TaxID=1576369 RepID=UPI0011138C64|nr:hypothetical protein [Planctomicrobium piriforme]
MPSIVAERFAELSSFPPSSSQIFAISNCNADGDAIRRLMQVRTEQFACHHSTAFCIVFWFLLVHVCFR